jgi:hypothetical protein
VGGRRIVAGIVVAVGALVVPAAPAAADHAIDWGVGRACGETTKTAETTVDTPVAFIACVTLGGEPLPGHELTVAVVGPSRSAETTVTTDDAGIARFGVQPTSEGDTRVTLCDADGCVYGETVLTVRPAPQATTTTTTPAAAATTTTTAVAVVAPTTAPAVVTTEAAPSETTTTTTPALVVTEDASSTTDGGDGDGGLPAWLIPALLLVVLVVLGLTTWWRHRLLTSPVAMIPSPDIGGAVPDEGGPAPRSTPRPEGAIRPIIFVPGIMASALATRAADGTLQQVWPPLGFGNDIRQCLEALKARKPGDFEIDTATGDGLLDAIHEGMIRTLVGHGYRNAPPRPNLYVYPYNWMQPCADAGRGLAELIDRANADWGVPPGVIVHSMGGLVLRAAWHLHGARDIDKVMYIGSPHLGASMAYFVLHPNIPYSFLGGTQGDILNAAYALSITARKRNAPASTAADLVRLVSNYFAAPALFDETLKLVAKNAAGVVELLPDEQYFTHVNPTWPVARRLEATTRATLADAQRLPDMVWVGSGRGEGADVAQPVRYTRTPATWQELYLTDPDLQLPGDLHERVRQAMDFKQRISGPLPPENGSNTMIVYGAAQPTLSTADYRVDDGAVHVQLSGAQGGDGTVPKESGRGEPLWSGTPTVTVENGSEHFRLTELASVHLLVRQFFPPGGAT